MRILKRVTYLLHYGDRFCLFDRQGFHGLTQIQAMHIFHHQIRLATRSVSKIEDRHYVGMRKFGERFGFTFESIKKFAVAWESTINDFYSNISVQVRLTGMINHPHSSPPNQSLDFELRKGTIELLDTWVVCITGHHSLGRQFGSHSEQANFTKSVIQGKATLRAVCHAGPVSQFWPVTKSWKNEPDIPCPSKIMRNHQVAFL